MRKLWFAAAALAMVSPGAAVQQKPRTIKAWMETTHKGADNLASEVRNGRGTPEDHKKLLEVYKTLATMKPPRGDEKSWKAKTSAVIAALTDLVDKKPGAVDRVHATTDCRACHDVHRVGGNK